MLFRKKDHKAAKAAGSAAGTPDVMPETDMKELEDNVMDDVAGGRGLADAPRVPVSDITAELRDKV